MSLNLSSPEQDVQIIEDLISELEKSYDSVPEAYRGTEVHSSISEVILAHRRADPTEAVEVPEYRGQLISSTEDCLESFETLPDGSNQLY